MTHGIKMTYLCPTLGVKHHVSFRGQLNEAFPAWLFYLDADCAVWQDLAQVTDTL